ncbi:hypothetical protein NCC78_06290 [Micromonospora phytophila]|uniref:hypothetical protein n=1 Tax=Micromonospora phytophila TaxID=709888 RepID=UPI00202F9902|nr:hypothetical protein [Micromonospora phytophila]MCM0674297.1 hypothetical protein [Micromonospora phytophila]
MSTDMENLVETLRSRADGDTDAAALLAGATAVARRRRIRMVAGGSAAAAVLAVSGLAALLLPQPPSGGYAVPGSPSATGPAAVTTTVGSDPLMIHFGVGRFPYPVRTVEWSVIDGVEKMSLWGNTVTLDDPHNHDDTLFFADLTLVSLASPAPAPDPSEPPREPQVQETGVSVAGHPATVTTGRHPLSDKTQTIVSWEPTPGVRAELSLRGPVPRKEIIAFASTLRLDVTRQCAVRVRVTAMPEDARLTGCRTTADSSAGWLQLRGPAGTVEVSVSAMAVFHPGTAPSAGTTPATGTTAGEARLRNGWSYEVLDPAGNTQNHTAWIRVFDPYLEVFTRGDYGLAQALLVAGGLETTS